MTKQQRIEQFNRINFVSCGIEIQNNGVIWIDERALDLKLLALNIQILTEAKEIMEMKDDGGTK